jgi:hypothetical protein
MMSWIVNASPVKWQTPTLDMSTARLAKLKLCRWRHHQPTERERIGDEIKAASIFARAYVNRNPRAIVTFS